jgi:hypothetical protein
MTAAPAITQSASLTERKARIAAPGPAREAQLRLLLGSGGDERLWLDPVSRRNRYGAPVGPAPDELWFSSSTACAVSPRGWAAAGEALERLVSSDPRRGADIDAWFDGLRGRLLRHYGRPACEAVLCASGTEAEFLALLIARRLAGGAVANIVVAPAETGSGVPAAAAGRHFLARSSLGGPVAKGERLEGWRDAGIAVETLDIRRADGALRAPVDVDQDAAMRVERAVSAGAFALLHVLDASKTGQPGVSRAATREILARYPDRVLVVVDACQLRCPASVVQADLESGLSVMLTGSKFAGGPPFSGALMIPPTLAERLGEAGLGAEELAQYSAALDWPGALRPALPHPANLGLGLRWAAALAEIEAYEAAPRALRTELLSAFDRAVRERVEAARGLALLDPADRPGAPGLTAIVHTDGVDARATYEALQRPAGPDRPICHLGQPVTVGARTALRVCASMPMITAAAEHGFQPLARELDRVFAAWEAARRGV